MELFEDMPDAKAPDETAMEPEVDRLMPARESRFLVGHDKVCKHLMALVSAGRLPHGIMFCGMHGIGKATTAFAFARFLLSNSKNEDMFDSPDGHPVNARVAAGGEPDLLTIEQQEGKLSIGIDAVRRIAHFVHHTASQKNGWRVVIVDDADTMTIEAQNALLKVLEEPPPKTVIILITHRLGALLPTVRSRASVQHFCKLSSNDMSKILSLSQAPPSPQDIELLYSLSSGSVGRAISYIEADAPDIWRQIQPLLEKPDWQKIHKLADAMGRKDSLNSYNTFADLFMWHSFNKCRDNLGNQDIVQQHDALDSHFKKVKYSSLDKRYGVIGAFSKL